MSSSDRRQIEGKTLLNEETEAVIRRMINEQFSQYVESSTTKDEITERVTECFDTSLPIDSLTGTSPLHCRITERIDSRQKNNVRNDINSSNQSNADIGIKNNIIQSDEIYSGSENQKSEVSEHNFKLKGLDKIQIIMCVLLSVFLLWLLFTVSKAIKSFKN